MNTPKSPMEQLLQDPPGLDVMIKKYLRILRNYRKVIILSTLLIGGGWLAYLFLQPQTSTYRAEATLRLNHSQDDSKETIRRTRNQLTAVLNANQLLWPVIDSLHLNFSIENDGLSAEDIFSELQIDHLSVAGEYKLVRKDSLYQLHYRCPKKRRTEVCIAENIEGSVDLNEHGISFRLNNDFLASYPFKQAGEITFRIKDQYSTLQSLRGRITHAWRDRKIRNFLQLSVASRSPEKAAWLSNLLGERIVDLYNQVNTDDGSGDLLSLQNKMHLAKKEWERANQKLSDFKRRHPELSLDRLFLEKNVLAERLTQINDLRQHLSEKLVELRTQYDIDAQIVTVKQIQSILSLNSNIRTPFPYTELQPLIDQRSGMRNQNQQHHKVRQNREDLSEIITNVRDNTAQFVNELKQKNHTLLKRITQVEKKLQTRPEVDAELRKLASQAQIKSDLYLSLEDKYNQTRIAQKVPENAVVLFESAIPPPYENPYANLLLKALVGLAAGLGAGISLAIFINLFNKTAANSEQLYDRLRLPVLGSIPMIEQEKNASGIPNGKNRRRSQLVTLDYTPTLASESYRELRTKILLMHQNEGLRSFLISSLNPGDGKSLTAANLAVTIAQQKIPVVLIDGDIRRGVQHNIFGNQKRPGLSDLLISKATIDMNNISKIIQPTFVPNLFLISAGSPIPNPAEMLGSDRMRQLLKILANRFGVNILDTAPFGLNADAVMLSDRVDASMIVVRAGATNTDVLLQRLRQYPELGRKLKGVLLNKVKVAEKRHQMDYQHSYYNY